MKNDRIVNDLAEDGSDLYPHLKITAEFFPRVLATRRIEDDGAEYFGAFLTKSAVRILIHFLNRVFRLRSCDIRIDGSFAVPCTQFYVKRCIAPCVANICDRERYLEIGAIVRLFLANDRRQLHTAITERIVEASEQLDFETAAKWRDILIAIEAFWQNPRLQVWLDDTVDTYEQDETVAGSFIYLVSQRDRHILSRKVFQLPRGGGMSSDEALERIISSFYRFHLPREIRISFDFERRPQVTEELAQRFGRPTKIVLVRPNRQQVTAIRALKLARSESDLDFVAARSTPRQIAGELKRLFALDSLPLRIEAFDVAHISGKSFAAAWSVWENGHFPSEEFGFHISDETSEPSALAEAVGKRVTTANAAIPDILLLDGGKTQLNTVKRAFAENGITQIKLLGAVKPAGQHSSLAYFIDDGGERFEYEADNPAQNMLRLLRDAAHDLANRVHRDLRDLAHHYELAAMLPSIDESDRRRLIADVGSLQRIRDIDPDKLTKLVGAETAARISADLENAVEIGAAVPLIVPIRFVAENGDADDLRPIDSRSIGTG